MKKPISQDTVKKTKEKLEDKLSKSVKEIDKDGEKKKGGFKLSGISLKTTGVQNSWRDKAKGFKEGKEIDFKEIKQFFEGDFRVVEIPEEEVWGGNLEETVGNDPGNSFSDSRRDNYESKERGNQDFYKENSNGKKDFYSANRSGDDFYKGGPGSDEEIIANVKNFYNDPSMKGSKSEAMRSFDNSALAQTDFRDDYMKMKKDNKYE